MPFNCCKGSYTLLLQSYCTTLWRWDFGDYMSLLGFPGLFRTIMHRCVQTRVVTQDTDSPQHTKFDSRLCEHDVWGPRRTAPITGFLLTIPLIVMLTHNTLILTQYVFINFENEFFCSLLHRGPLNSSTEYKFGDYQTLSTWHDIYTMDLSQGINVVYLKWIGNYF